MVSASSASITMSSSQRKRAKLASASRYVLAVPCRPTRAFFAAMPPMKANHVGQGGRRRYSATMSSAEYSTPERSFSVMMSASRLASCFTFAAVSRSTAPRRPSVRRRIDAERPSHSSAVRR